MVFAKIGLLTLNTFDKNNKNALEFIKKLCNDESISKRFQGITRGLLSNKNNEFFNHGFLVAHNNEFIGYIKIGEYIEDEKCIYLRAAIDKEKRGHSYGSLLLNEITEYTFQNYPEVKSIHLKIDLDNKPSLMTAKSCGYELLSNEIFVKENPYINKKHK